jgi:hypothetical protein
MHSFLLQTDEKLLQRNDKVEVAGFSDEFWERNQVVALNTSDPLELMLAEENTPDEI